ncbi:MAG: glycosyltransferase [Acidobacteria bacterium]|nr:glycosyltransferase [Acidobacteriota bacterium]
MKIIPKFIFLLFAPLLLLALWLGITACDMVWKLQGRRRSAQRKDRTAPHTEFAPPRNASVVIPNWNGKDLLEKYLSPLLAACRDEDEIIVVDNASADGSVEYIRKVFPRVRVLEMERNLGFGGGSNAGVQAAKHPVVILLNNDMRVLPGFVEALLAGFDAADVFAVSAQIFFSDPNKRREETGLTAGQFEKGFIRVRHIIDPNITQIAPTLYAGGGSTAYDREKFLSLGGFDPLFEPFYLEDTDLSFNAWRQRWRVLYQPAAHVYHEHRGTIGKHFTPETISAYLQKNYVLMTWKNIHRPAWMALHFAYTYGHMVMSFLGRWTPTRTTIGAFSRALRTLPKALRARRHAILNARLETLSIFNCTSPALYRDQFLPLAPQREAPAALPAPPSGQLSPALAPARRLNILFVSPYSIYPPLHGGAVFMYQALEALSKRHNIHLLTFVDRAEEVTSNETLRGMLQSVDVLLRRYQPHPLFRLESNAEQTFRDPAFAERLERLILEHRIDLVQFEYTQLAQFHLPLQNVAQCLFEHDVYFRSVQHQLTGSPGRAMVKAREFLEWLRAIRFELRVAKKFDALFTCNVEEQRLLQSFLNVNDKQAHSATNRHGPRIYSGLRTAVTVASYTFPGGPRTPDSLLFVGNFNHPPNRQAIEYFCSQVLPEIRRLRPQAKLTVVGANAPSDLMKKYTTADGVSFTGQVPDIRDPLGSHAIFVAPILTGAGVRVKILEAFASGIPVVSTPFGAEGLEIISGENGFLASTPREFAQHVLTLLEDPARATRMAAAAHQMALSQYDWSTVVSHLDEIYQELVDEKLRAADQRW